MCWGGESVTEHLRNPNRKRQVPPEGAHDEEDMGTRRSPRGRGTMAPLIALPPDATPPTRGVPVTMVVVNVRSTDASEATEDAVELDYSACWHRLRQVGAPRSSRRVPGSIRGPARIPPPTRRIVFGGFVPRESTPTQRRATGAPV